MRTFEFVCEEHKEYGGLGWRLSDKPGFDPLPGLTVAHDVLEHFPNGDDSPADEFQALGAAYHIRGDTGYMQRNGNVNPPSAHIASDFPDIFRHVIDEGMGLATPPKTRKLTEDHDHAERFVLDVLANVRKEMRSDDYDESFAKEVVRLLPLAGDWMRRGYRRACKRYSGCQFEAMHVFDLISKKADEILKHASEGDRITVKFDVRSACAWVEQVYEYEGAYD